MRNTYHICLASHDEVLHRSVEDYIYDVNCFAVAVHRTDSRALADAFMSTHDHSCVQTDGFITELEGIRRIVTAVSYVNRNPLHHGMTSTPFGYKYCSANAIFRRELGKGSIEPAANQHIRHRFLPRNCSLPDSFRVDESGMILQDESMEDR